MEPELSEKQVPSCEGGEKMDCETRLEKTVWNRKQQKGGGVTGFDGFDDCGLWRCFLLPELDSGWDVGRSVGWAEGWELWEGWWDRGG